MAITKKNFEVLKNRTFFSVWSGFLISRLGDGFFTIALGYIVYTKSGSGLAMSSVFVAQMLGTILIGPIAGTYADRTNRRNLMIFTDIIRGILVFLLMILLTFYEVNIPLIISITFVLSAASTFNSTAFHSSVLNMVGQEHIAGATSLLQLTMTTAQIAGPAMAGLVVTTAGGPWALLIDSISYFVSALTVILVKFSNPYLPAEKRKTFTLDLTDGVKWILKQPVVLGVSLFGTSLSLFGAAHTVLIYIISLKIWKVTGFEYSLLEIAWPIGLAIASGLLLLVPKIDRRGLLICGAFVVSGSTYMIASVMADIYTALPFLVVSGILAGGGATLMTILMRQIVPSEFQGRVFGMYGSLSNATWPLGALIGGFLSESMDAVQLAVICGAGLLLTGVFGLLNKPLRLYH
ncbi:MFS transporter [Paenibacillus chitinolyticus]|uniref:MFS transporter n=1 Tax=Paenibacillus chitinolyticus TaxID=79263 RepID=UPI003646516A